MESRMFVEVITKSRQVFTTHTTSVMVYLSITCIMCSSTLVTIKTSYYVLLPGDN